MMDESFHLTPLDVRRYDFGAALRGYDKARVDQFRDQVADELERLTRINQDLETKAKGFHEQLRAFRERDKALNEALVSAQQLRAEIREQAEREAQLIVREARAEGEALVAEAAAKVRTLQAAVDALERTRRSYLAQIRAVVERQLADLDAAERLPAPPADPAVAAATAPPAAGEGAGDGAPRSATPTWLDAAVREDASA
jgi:DivIVA domain-containing protein